MSNCSDDAKIKIRCSPGPESYCKDVSPLMVVVSDAGTVEKVLSWGSFGRSCTIRCRWLFFWRVWSLEGGQPFDLSRRASNYQLLVEYSLLYWQHLSVSCLEKAELRTWRRSADDCVQRDRSEPKSSWDTCELDLCRWLIVRTHTCERDLSSVIEDSQAGGRTGVCRFIADKSALYIVRTNKEKNERRTEKKDDARHQWSLHCNNTSNRFFCQLICRRCSWIRWGLEEACSFQWMR